MILASDDEEDAAGEDDDDGYMYFDSDAPPDGFEAYPMASPAVYLADSIAVGLFLFLCCDDGAWMLGKIMKDHPWYRGGHTAGGGENEVG